jgi:hypothetical protein
MENFRIFLQDPELLWAISVVKKNKTGCADLNYLSNCLSLHSSAGQL